MSKVKFNLVENCMDDCNENDIVFVDEPYWDTSSVLNSQEEVVYNRIKEIVNGNNTPIVNVGTKGHIDHGLTQEQIMIGMGRMGGCDMKGLSLASNLVNQDPSNYIGGTLRHEIPRYRGDLLESVYRNIKYINDTDFMDILYETEECKGDFDKITKGKHTYPFWYKGK